MSDSLHLSFNPGQSLPLPGDRALQQIDDSWPGSASFDGSDQVFGLLIRAKPADLDITHYRRRTEGEIYAVGDEPNSWKCPKSPWNDGLDIVHV